MEFFALSTDIITMILTIVMCFGALKKWKTSERVTFYYIFVFFYVLPIFLDYFYAFPDYSYSPKLHGFKISHNDPATRVLYNYVVLSVQWLLLHIKVKKYDFIVIHDEKEHSMKIKAFLYIGLIAAPVFVLLLGRDKSILYTFMWRENELAQNGYLPVAERLSYVGICCAVALFFQKAGENKFLTRVISILFCYINICIEGKRSITFFLLLVIFVAMLPGVREHSISLKKIKKKILALALLLAIILAIMVIFTIHVKMINRGYSTEESVYTSIRIDIFRDDRVKMAIYSLLNPGKMKILSYPGQTLAPAVLNFFPLDYISGFVGIRPLAYTAYISAALTGNTLISQEAAFMSPTIFAELTSNFHVFGIFLMIALTLWFAKVTERYPYPINLFIIISYIMLNMYSVSYIAYFLEITFFICLLCRMKF